MERHNQMELAFTEAKFAQNSVVHHSTGCSPFSVVYSKAIRHALDLIKFLEAHFSIAQLRIWL